MQMVHWATQITFTTREDRVVTAGTGRLEVLGGLVGHFITHPFILSLETLKHRQGTRLKQSCLCSSAGLREAKAVLVATVDLAEVGKKVAMQPMDCLTAGVVPVAEEMLETGARMVLVVKADRAVMDPQSIWLALGM
ncbi:hypothetical protein [Leisingera sp. McT4-56]|uniref:hypothetical protein n=1 Tax=Leisingera sp. McT4-56 TaxID=2881255 RepID=UPI0021F64C14|nr:hypothetical protein [Leisingera sp. McT4-56]